MVERRREERSEQMRGDREVIYPYGRASRTGRARPELNWHPDLPQGTEVPTLQSQVSGSGVAHPRSNLAIASHAVRRIMGS